jgi:phosphonate transport system substrate-binding protein
MAGTTASDDAASSAKPSSPDAAPDHAPALYRDELLLPDTLGVGRVARNVASHLPALEAMSSWLEDRVADLGYKKVRPVVARDNAEMVDFLRRGIVDVVSETPLSAVHFVKSAGATIVLRETRKGNASYDAVVFVRADSPVHSLADLRSHRIAFEDAGSTTAFLLPLASLKRAGIPAIELATPSTPVPPDAVGYFFALSENSIVGAVSRKVADAGALSDEEWKAFSERNPDSFAKLRIIHESERIPRAFLLTGPRVSPAQRRGLEKLLLAMNNNPDARETLDRYNDVDRFVTVDGEALAAIAEIEKTYDLVSGEMNEVDGDKETD